MPRLSTSACSILPGKTISQPKKLQNLKTSGDVRGIDGITFPLTYAEERLLERMVKVKMEHSHDKKTLVCRTSGQPLCLRHIPNPRKGSAIASTPVKKRRAREERKCREKIAGPLAEDHLKQMAVGLKTTNPRTARKALDLAGHGQKNLTPKEMVVMQNKMGFSNRGSRVFTQTLRKKGLKPPTEKEVKEFKEGALCGTRTVENKMVLEHHGPHLLPTPYETPAAEIKDLVEFVTETLDKLDAKVSMFFFSLFFHFDVTYIILIKYK